MKTTTILCDGTGQFRCARVPSPEAFRQAVSQETGSARVLFALALVLNTPNGECLTNLKTEVLDKFEAAPGLAHCPHFLWAVVRCLLVRPLLARLRQRLVSQILRITGIKAMQRTLRRIGEATAFQSRS